MDALELEARRRIYDYVRTHPGAHVREIMLALGMPQGQASYHLDVLERRGLLAAAKEEYHRRFFVAGSVPRPQRALARFLKARVPRAALLALLAEPGLRHGDLAGRVGVRPGTLTYHMRRLEAAGVVERAHDGAQVRYRVVEPDAVIDALVTFRGALMDAAVDRFLETWAQMHPGQLRRDPGEGEPERAGQGEGQPR